MKKRTPAPPWVQARQDQRHPQREEPQGSARPHPQQPHHGHAEEAQAGGEKSEERERGDERILQQWSYSERGINSPLSPCTPKH